MSTRKPEPDWMTNRLWRTNTGIRYGRETPLHSAARSGSKLQVRLLLDHGGGRLAQNSQSNRRTEATRGVDPRMLRRSFGP